MNLNNDNVRELATKGAKIEAHRPAPRVRAASCTKDCCNAHTELFTVERVRKFKDGRTRVFVLDAYGSGRTLVFPMTADNVSTYSVVTWGK